MLILVILNALFASTITIGKMALEYTKPVFFTGMSMLIGGAFLVMYQLIKDPKKLKIAPRDIGSFLQVSIFSIFLSYTLYFWALNSLPSFKACFFYNLGPFTSYIIGYALFQEKMMIQKWAGLCVGLAGLLPMLWSSTSSKPSLISFIPVSLPEVAAIISVTVYSYGWFIVRRLIHEKHYSAITVNGVSMVIGGLLSLSSVPFVEGAVQIKHFPSFLQMLGATILIEYIICNHLYALLLKKYSETFLSFSTFLIPFFGALYGWLFLHERITWHFLLSSTIIAYAIWLFYHAEKAEKTSNSSLNLEL